MYNPSIESDSDSFPTGNCSNRTADNTFCQTLPTKPASVA